MSNYSTRALVLRNLPTAVQSSTSLVSSATVLTMLNRADAIINGKLAAAYSVPVSNCPLLETIATDLACYGLLRRSFTGEQKNASDWPAKYKESMELLDDIAQGGMTLVTSAGTAIARSSSAVWSSSQNYLPTFHEGDDHFVDPDKLIDLEDERL